MASNQTSNYGLNQWEATDEVLRTDFNADNAKIDTALSEKADAAEVTALSQTVDGKAEQADLESLTQQVTQLEGLPQMVTGTYTGDGSESRFISLGFTPKVILVFLASGYPANPYVNFYFGGLAFLDYPVRLNHDASGTTVLQIEEGGFRVYYNWDDGIRTNQNKAKFYYLAWK